MKLSTREDIEASIEATFNAITDFDGFERQMMRRGVDIIRDDTSPIGAPGAKWSVAFDWRGRGQKLEAKLLSIEQDQGFAMESLCNGVVCTGVLDLVALSKQRTRLFVSLDLRPTTLSSRLLIQSLKLAKGNLTKRFKHRVTEFAAKVSDL